MLHPVDLDQFVLKCCVCGESLRSGEPMIVWKTSSVGMTEYFNRKLAHVECGDREVVR